jgi:hypothetical protein
VCQLKIIIITTNKDLGFTNFNMDNIIALEFDSHWDIDLHFHLKESSNDLIFACFSSFLCSQKPSLPPQNPPYSLEP